MNRNTRKILKGLKSQIDNITYAANNNADCKGFAIVFGNYSINVPPQDQEEFWYELEEMEDKYKVSFEVNEYNDLCLTTSEFESEF